MRKKLTSLLKPRAAEDSTRACSDDCLALTELTQLGETKYGEKLARQGNPARRVTRLGG